mmetsp:Transcript_61328/g.97149  ORF Transcript_61328/g.97149 Transcript_61328/m.97149 type:complete len:216 (+) Transcript_61328:765-1412(+)
MAHFVHHFRITQQPSAQFQGIRGRSHGSKGDHQTCLLGSLDQKDLLDIWIRFQQTLHVLHGLGSRATAICRGALLGFFPPARDSLPPLRFLHRWRRREAMVQGPQTNAFGRDKATFVEVLRPKSRISLLESQTHFTSLFHIAQQVLIMVILSTTHGPSASMHLPINEELSTLIPICGKSTYSKLFAMPGAKGHIEAFGLKTFHAESRWELRSEVL